MKSTILLLLTMVAGSLGFSQSIRADHSGNASYEGHLELSTQDDPTSIHIGLEAGIPILKGVSSRNTILGVQAGYRELLPVRDAILGKDNTLVGFRAGNNLGYGIGNTLLGSGAGTNLFSGDNNTIVGYNAGPDTDVSGSMYIGYEAGQGTSLGDNKLFIGHGNAPLLYADFNSRRIGVNYSGILEDVFHVEAPANRDAMRVRVGGVTRLRVHDNGGVSFGMNRKPKRSNGAVVSNLSGSSSGRVMVDPSGNLIRSSHQLFHLVPVSDIRRSDWNNLTAFGFMTQTFYTIESGDINENFVPLNLEHGSIINQVNLTYSNKLREEDNVKVYLRKHVVNNNLIDTEDTLLFEFEGPSDVIGIEDVIYNNISLEVDNENAYYDLYFDVNGPSCFGCLSRFGLLIYHLAIGYEIL